MTPKNEIRKIAICGTHGVGKSTLAYQLAAAYKTQGLNCKVINETARSCPFPLNHGMTIEAAMWIAHSHINKELEAQARLYQVVVSDRSSIDSLMYASHFGLHSHPYYPGMHQLAERWLNHYYQVVFVRPDPDYSATEDGIRDTGHAFRASVDQQFETFFNHTSVDLKEKLITVNAAEIFGGTACKKLLGS